MSAADGATPGSLPGPYMPSISARWASRRATACGSSQGTSVTVMIGALTAPVWLGQMSPVFPIQLDNACTVMSGIITSNTAPRAARTANTVMLKRLIGPTAKSAEAGL